MPTRFWLAFNLTYRAGAPNYLPVRTPYLLRQIPPCEFSGFPRMPDIIHIWLAAWTTPHRLLCWPVCDLHAILPHRYTETHLNSSGLSAWNFKSTHIWLDNNSSYGVELCHTSSLLQAYAEFTAQCFRPTRFWLDNNSSDCGHTM